MSLSSGISFWAQLSCEIIYWHFSNFYSNFLYQSWIYNVWLGALLIITSNTCRVPAKVFTQSDIQSNLIPTLGKSLSLLSNTDLGMRKEWLFCIFSYFFGFLYSHFKIMLLSPPFVKSVFSITIHLLHIKEFCKLKVWWKNASFCLSNHSYLEI